MGAVRTQCGGDVVPLACGDACEGKALGLDEEEVSVSVLFDGEEDGAVILSVEFYGFRSVGGLGKYGFGGCVGGWGLVCGLGAADEEEGCQGEGEKCLQCFFVREEA